MGSGRHELVYMQLVVRESLRLQTRWLVYKRCCRLVGWHALRQSVLLTVVLLHYVAHLLVKVRVSLVELGAGVAHLASS